MDPTTPNPQNPVQIGTIYAEPALEKIRAAVRGNGIKAENVTLKNIGGEIAQFPAQASLILRVRTMERVQAGKKTGMEKVDGPQGLRDTMEKERVRILSAPDVLNQIKDFILERKDKGFGTRNEIVKLPFLTQEYVHHQGCTTCGTRGEIKCQRCHGKGFETCPRCNGQSMELCGQCRGAQIIYNGNNNVPCPRCNGQGRTPCTMCNQTRKITCNVCKTKGATPCQTCHGHGWHSYITSAEIDVLSTFKFNPDLVPQKLHQIMATRIKDVPDYADIITTVELPKTDAEKQNKTDEIIVNYHITLPYAEAEFDLGGKETAHAFLLGRQAELISIPSFVEGLIRKGMHSLQDAAEGRGNVAQQINRAGQYRTIRQGIIAAAKYSKGKAAKLMKKNNPIGISDNAIKIIIAHADKAIKNITAKPRRNGVFVGALVAFALYLAYIAAGLRTMLLSGITDPILHIAADGVVIAVGMMFAVFTIQLLGAGAMKKALAKLLPPEQKSMILPKAGHSGLWSALLCLVMFLLAAEATLQIKQTPPDWYMMARSRLIEQPVTIVPDPLQQPQQ